MPLIQKSLLLQLYSPVNIFTSLSFQKILSVNGMNSQENFVFNLHDNTWLKQVINWPIFAHGNMSSKFSWLNPQKGIILSHFTLFSSSNKMFEPLPYLRSKLEASIFNVGPSMIKNHHKETKLWYMSVILTVSNSACGQLIRNCRPQIMLQWLLTHQQIVVNFVHFYNNLTIKKQQINVQASWGWDVPIWGWVNVNS